MKLLITTLALLLASVPALAMAEAPRVRFDAPQIVAARDATTREFAFVHPDERLIEVRVPISMLLDRGPAADVREVVHKLESTTLGAQAVDYFPKTTLATSIVGTTSVEQQRQRDLRATADIAGGYYGVVHGQAHGEYASRTREDSRYQQLPPLELVTASGTVDRGRGVYFKLKPTARTTVEGAHDYIVVLRVPRAWRAGLVYASSEARGVERTNLPGGDASTIVGRGKFVIAVYQQGDNVAQQAAQRYAQAEAALRQVAHEQRARLERKTYPTALHKLGVTRDGALARDWQESVIFRGAADSTLLERLPGDVRLAVENLLKSREALIELHQAATLAKIEG